MVIPDVVYLSVVESDGKGDVSGDNVVKSKVVFLSVDIGIVVENDEVEEYDVGKRDEGMFVVFRDLSSI